MGEMEGSASLRSIGSDSEIWNEMTSELLGEVSESAKSISSETNITANEYAAEKYDICPPLDDVTEMTLEGNPPSSGQPGSSPPSPQPSPRLSPRWHRRHNWSTSHSTSTNSTIERLDISNLDSEEVSESSYITGETVARGSPIGDSSSKEKKDKKKKSWFNNFYPTYKSRSEDFKRIFKEIPPDERLVVDYSCALQKEMIVHGRLYVTQNYLCFYGNIFRWEQVVVIRWKDVTALTREKTALVIPNAILVCTDIDKVFFTSFGTRDKAYLMLFRVWQNALMGQQMPLEVVWQWVHLSYGQELGLTTDDEDYIEPEDKKATHETNTNGLLPRQAETGAYETMVVNKRTMPGGSPTPSLQMEQEESRPNSSVPPATTTSTTATATVTVTATATVTTCATATTAVTSTATTTCQDGNASPQPTSNEPPVLPVASSTPSRRSQDVHLDTDMSDTTESEPEKAVGNSPESICECTSPHDGREMMRLVLPVSVDNLFTALFTDSKFFLDFHNQRNTTNMRLTPWERSTSDKDKQRIIHFDVPINQALVGRKTSQVTEVQIMRSKPGKMYSIDTETSNIGFPYADSFYTCAHYCLKKTGDNESSIVVYVDIKFRKQVWVMKSYIEKHTWVGLEEFYIALATAISSECNAIVDGLSCRPLVKDVSKPKRRLRNAPRKLSTAQRLSEEAIVPHIVRPTVVGRRSVSRGSVGSPDRRYEPGIPSNPRVQRPTISTKPVRTRTDTINYVVLAVLVVLMMLNGVLYYKLWALEQWSLTDPFGPSIHTDLAALKQHPPKTHEEWLLLLRKQESLHNMEVHKWHKVLRSAVILLKKTEESLRDLQASIQPRINRKVTPSQHSEL